MQETHYTTSTDEQGKLFLNCPFEGKPLLLRSLYNKGTAFTAEERKIFKLQGLVPPVLNTLDEQVERVHQGIQDRKEPLAQYMALVALQDRNETLFYRLVSQYIEEYAPVVYTPTVGLACQHFSRIFRRGRGLWITPEDRGHIIDVLDNWPQQQIKLIVVTDNERILGLGDQGAGGMGIPIGKLILYTVAAGIHPSQVLPISLDVGTDNQELLNDPWYIGYKKARLRGAEYDSLIEEFVKAVKTKYPRVLLQWEDFKKANAFNLLNKYRKRLLSFNDDIQGTASVALAGIMAATRITGLSMKAQCVVISGAGAAGIGIARQIRNALQQEGLSDACIEERIVLLDSRGPLLSSRIFSNAYKEEFVIGSQATANLGLLESDGLLEVIDKVKPTVLIGTSGQANVFTEDLVKMMDQHVERPVIFPFSNPTSLSEAKPEDLIKWTDGRVIIATGSPFDPVTHAGKVQKIAQGNNVYIFPGVGLGAIVADAAEVTDSMFTAAAHTLAQQVSAAELEQGLLFPSLKRLREVSREIAKAVVMVAGQEGVGELMSVEAAAQRVDAEMWQPKYLPFTKID